MDIGAILSEAWSLYTRFFVRFVVAAGVVFLALGAISTIVEQSAGDSAGALVASLASVLVTIIGIFWIQGVLVVLTADVRDGRADETFGELFERVRPKLGRLVVAGLLAGLGIAVGLIALVVPGLYLFTRWSMIVPGIILEDLEWGASFSRSHDLVRNRAWPVFGTLIVLLIINVIVSGAIVVLINVLSSGWLGSWIGSALANTLVVPFIAIATTLLYFRLARDRPPGTVYVPESA